MNTSCQSPVRSGLHNLQPLKQKWDQARAEQLLVSSFSCPNTTDHRTTAKAIQRGSKSTCTRSWPLLGTTQNRIAAVFSLTVFLLKVIFQDKIYWALLFFFLTTSRFTHKHTWELLKLFAQGHIDIGYWGRSVGSDLDQCASDEYCTGLLSCRQ